MVTAIFVPISFPMPTCLIHAVFDLWRIVKKNKLSLILKCFYTRIYTSELYEFMYAYIHCTCGLWDVKQMIFVHDYLKLMDKIWPLSALHLHHRRTSTNDRSRKAELLISSSSYHCTTILLSILQSHIIVYTVNHWKQFNKRIYLQMPISIFLQFITNKVIIRALL